MPRLARWFALSLLAFTVPGCATLQELAALRSVTFRFDRVSGVRLAGVALSPGMKFADLSLTDVARVSAAVAAREVPLELVAHVRATNPAENSVAARMLSLDWTLFVEDRRMLGGQVAEAVRIAPGESADVPVSVRFNLLSLEGGGARALVDVALGVAGQGSASRELRLELMPTIDTPLGPMRYAAPIVVRHGGAAK